MILPEPMHTLLGLIRRARGGSFAAATAYARGEIVVDYQNERFNYAWRETAQEIEFRVLCGWTVRPGETEAAAVQRLCVAVGVAGGRSDAVEGRTLIFEIPAETTPAQRARIVAMAAAYVHEHTGCAVVAAGHGPPRDSAHVDNFHAHLVISHRTSDGESLGKPGRVLDHPVSGGKLVAGLRRELTREYARLATAGGWDRTWSHETYEVLYTRLNVERAAAGLELLEIPTPQEHEGPALTAKRRVGIRASPTMLRNDRIRQANWEIRSRNRARISRDSEIVDLRVRLDAAQQMSRLGRERRGRNWTPAEKAQMDELYRVRGSSTVYRNAIAEAHELSLAHLSLRYGEQIERALAEIRATRAPRWQHGRAAG